MSVDLLYLFLVCIGGVTCGPINHNVLYCLTGKLAAVLFDEAACTCSAVALNAAIIGCTVFEAECVGSAVSNKWFGLVLYDLVKFTCCGIWW